MIGIDILILLMMKSRGKERLVISQSHLEKRTWVATGMLSIPELCCLLSHWEPRPGLPEGTRSGWKDKIMVTPAMHFPTWGQGPCQNPPNPAKLDSLKVHDRHIGGTVIFVPWLNYMIPFDSQWPWEEARKGIIIFIYDYFIWIIGDISSSQSDWNRFLSCCSFNCGGNNLPVKAEVTRRRDHFLYVRVPFITVQRENTPVMTGCYPTVLL